MAQRVLALGLDGYEPSLGDEMMAAGRLPNFRRLRARGASWRLDHGRAKRTGLAWEQVSTGLAPEASGRHAAVDFDPATYLTWQAPTALRPFAADLPVRTVVFDTPYFDLRQAAGVRGAVSWGAHDPGVPAFSRPAGLNEEIRTRFGPYPAEDYIYGFVWQSPDATARMARRIVEASALRGEIALWLLRERLPDWDLALVVVSEYHSAIEALWHGLDRAHPLHALPSAPAAGEAIRAVYEIADAMLGRLIDAFPDAAVVAFAMHGMGPNDSDVASMLLLPELMFRHAFGRPYLRARRWPATASGVPLLSEGEDWHGAMEALVPRPRGVRKRPSLRARRVLRRLTRMRRKGVHALDWMPAARYAPFWPAMPAFALPSYYDGRVRINLAGREAEGRVAVEDYDAACAGIESLLRAARNALTGEPAVDAVERCAGADPRALGPSESDLVVTWRSAPLGIVHPALGRIGPVPYRRTGGHSGPHGVAYVMADGVAPGARGTASAFDVVPTLLDLLGARAAPRLSGRSLLAREALAAE